MAVMRDSHLQNGRVDWVDYAKGFCIVFVVMMHSTLGVEAAAGREGFMHALVAFARPFRMPDFFMISGLFLGLVIDRDWRTYLDRKVVHFAYFYVLWMTIQFVVKAPSIAAAGGAGEVMRLYLLSLIDPFGTLWFIYLLPIFMVFTKLTRNVPPWLIWIVAALLQSAPIDTGWTVIDEFAGRFVYFYTGYWLARYVFALAARVQAKPLHALGGLALWGLLNGSLVYFGYATIPGISLALGLVGAAAVVSISALFAKSHVFEPLRYCGENSIVVYLAFFLPMAATRALLLKTGIIADVGVMAIIITAAGVLGSLSLFWLTRGTPLRFLFKRPAAFWLTEKKPQPVLQPAE
ncbi:MAG TPA: acyltransferase family protein [Pseudolabrys sp.]|nr:acyltransferase family protein [Pseudolabrys sp.]